jgi:hypothetical protein
MTFQAENVWHNDKDPKVFLCCLECGRAGLLNEARGTPGMRSHACMAGHVMTVDLSKLPDRFGPEAYAASPDGSCFAHWINHQPDHGRTVAPTGRKPPMPQPSGLGDLEAQVERLAALREYERANRARFADDPILLEAFDRLIARKKRTIMGNPD